MVKVHMTKTRARRVGGVLVACAIVAIVSVCLWPRRAGRVLPHVEPDLSNHPLYSTYEFGTDDRVIDFGVQPLWIPTCIISQTMKRDRILEKAFSSQGLELRFHPFLKGADINFFLRRGDIDVVIAGDMPALTAAADSNVVVAALIQHGFCSIVAKRPMLLTELRRKRIGYAFGSNAHYGLLDALSTAGLVEEDVRLIPIDVTEMPEALDAGTIEAFSAWEPTPCLATTTYTDQQVIHRMLSTGYLYFARGFAEQHPELLRQIVASELRAINWLDGDNLVLAIGWATEAGNKISANHLPVPGVEECVTLAKEDILGGPPSAALSQEDLADDGRLFREFDFLKALGKIPGTTKWERVRACFDASIIRQIRARGSKYQINTFDYLD